MIIGYNKDELQPTPIHALQLVACLAPSLFHDIALILAMRGLIIASLFSYSGPFFVVYDKFTGFIQS